MNKTEKAKLLKSIKAIISLPKNPDDTTIEQYEHMVTATGTGWGQRVYTWSWIIANPMEAIKTDSRLASKTNASKEAIQLIQNTNLEDLKKLLNGKDTSSTGGNSQ